MTELKQNPIDNVTVKNLGSALRMCHIQLTEDVIDKIIDLVELIETKGDDTSISDIFELQDSWKPNK